jgi:hypothetical protein
VQRLRLLAWLCLPALLAACVLEGLEAAAPTPPATAPAETATVPTAAGIPTQQPVALPTASATHTPPSPTQMPAATPTPAPSPTPPATAPAEAALRPAFAGDIAASADLPHYRLRFWLEPAAGILTGTALIEASNHTGALLADMALRLYPNFPRDVLGKGGDTRMQIAGATVNGRPVAVEDAAQQTAIVLPLVPELAPGARATLAVTFTATVRPWGDGTWPLPSYYPMLAPRDGDRWRMDVTRFPDRVFAESALYDVEIDVPSDMIVAASGSTIGETRRGDRATYHVVAGPVREFALTAGNLVAQRATAGDVVVNVYTARASQLDAGAIGQVAASALANFDRRFGPYPYRELDIHLLPGDYDGGDEYPGLILLYSNGPVDAGIRYAAAHEVAHQWWYGTIGNDIYREPWLDEALAQYSGIVYDEDVAGAAVAAADWEREVARRERGARADGDLPIGLAIDQYPNFNVYYRTVYGRGAVFLRTLRHDLGDEIFFAALRDYYAQNRYGIATTAALRQTFERASGRDLGTLFAGWVAGATGR